MALTSSSITEHIVKPLIAAAGSVFSRATAAFPFDRVLAGMVRVGLGIEAICTFLNLTRGVLDEHLVRLGLATPHDRRLRTPGKRGWSIQDTRRLVAWRVSGVHPEIIGQALEKPRSANAVRAKARRIGLAAPARKALFKPNPTSLCDPSLDFAFPTSEENAPESQCGRVADDSGFRDGNKGTDAGTGEVGPTEAVNASTSTIPLSSESPKRPTRHPGSLSRPAGQRELLLLGILGRGIADDGRKIEGIPERLLAPVPSSIEEIDLEGDLSWFKRIEVRPLSEMAVWVAGMLTMGGLNRFAAARRLGVSEGAFRTFRTNVAVPVDFDRKKFSGRFSGRGAWATLQASDYVVRKCIVSGKFFWARKSDRGSRCSPYVRRGYRSDRRRCVNPIEIITEAMLDAGLRMVRVPFAASRTMVVA